VASVWRTTQLKNFHHCPVYYPSIEARILGSPIVHLGGHDSPGINLHTWIYSLKFHPITKNHNRGTHQVGKTDLYSITILGFKDGEEGITKETLKLHLSLCPTILTLSFHQTSCSFCEVLFHHLYLLFHNNHKNTRMQAPQDRHYYRHNQFPITIIIPLNLFTMLRCKPS
jgi:hypothetical protein